jgi:ABC-type antimicrobial peptide transport system permease subunit
MASFVAERRTKEIGIRKVLGASVLNLWRLVSLEFVILVLIACAIAIPVSYLLLDNWLQGFEYRTGIPILVYLSASLGALFLTLFTVSFQSIRVAKADPVKSLKTE